MHSNQFSIKVPNEIVCFSKHRQPQSVQILQTISNTCFSQIRHVKQSLQLLRLQRQHEQNFQRKFSIVPIVKFLRGLGSENEYSLNRLQ